MGRGRGTRGKRAKLRWLPTAENLEHGIRVLKEPVKRVKVPGRKKWKQIRRLCAHAAINNLFGTTEIVTLQSLHAIAKELNTQHKVLYFGNADGDFHKAVLKRALAEAGYDMIDEQNESGSRRDHMWLSTQTEGKFLVLGWTAEEQGHWFSVDADACLVVCPAEAGFFELNAASLLKACSEGLAEIFRVTLRVD